MIMETSSGGIVLLVLRLSGAYIHICEARFRDLFTIGRKYETSFVLDGDYPETEEDCSLFPALFTILIIHTHIRSWINGG